MILPQDTDRDSDVLNRYYSVSFVTKITKSAKKTFRKYYLGMWQAFRLWLAKSAYPSVRVGRILAESFF